MPMKIQTAITFRSSNIPPFKVKVEQDETLDQKEAQVKEALAQNVTEGFYDVYQRDWLYDKSIIVQRKAQNPSFAEIEKYKFVPMTPEKRLKKAQELKAKGITPTDMFVEKMLKDEGLKIRADKPPTKRGFDIFATTKPKTSEQ